MQETPKSIVFGKNGFLGSHLNRFDPKNQNSYFGYKSAQNKLIITNKENPIIELPWSYEALVSVIHKLQPNEIINTIALINAEHCEKSPLLAEQANSEIPAVLATAASQVGATMVQISTDAVFGQVGSHFSENDEPHPISVYGKTKRQGEMAVMALAPKHLIIRTNFYGYHKTKQTLFNYFYQNLLLDRKVHGYEDVIFNPVYVKDLVHGMRKFIDARVQGILHFVGDEVLSKFDFGSRISQEIGQHSGQLTRQMFQGFETQSHPKLDLTLSSEIRKALYTCTFDIGSGIRDAILDVKADRNEL